MIALLIGALATLAMHFALMWGLGGDHRQGWLIPIAVGIGVALCVVRMTRERFVPLEQNRVSRVIARAYTPKRCVTWALRS